tara:strand:- start:1423 stop:2127 length:705 start_codon:yes stop_codon:yes gene_type:complete
MIDADTYIRDNAGLINKFVKKYFFDTPKFSKDDLFQVGAMAVARAIEGFDPNYGCKLVTYIGTAIDRAILNYVSSLKTDVYIPPKKLKELYEQEKKTGKKAAIQPNDFIALRLDWTPTHSDEDEPFSSVMPSGSPPPEESMMVEEQNKILLEEINNLPSQQKDLIMARYFDNKKLPEIGNSLGITKQGARQIEQRAFDKLRIRLHNRLGGTILRTDGLARRAKQAKTKNKSEKV